MELKYSRQGRDYVIDTEKLGPASLAYLLQNGFSQSLQDSFAGPRAKAIADKEGAETVEAVVTSCIDKRLSAIESGTVGIRTAVSRDPIRSMAMEMLKAVAASKGKKLPKKDATFRNEAGEEINALDALVAKFILANKDKIEAEIAARKARSNDLDLEDFD